MKKPILYLFFVIGIHLHAQITFTGFDIFPSPGEGCGPQYFRQADNENKLYFTSDYGFYGFGTSDGTVAGTYWSLNPQHIEVVNLTPFNHQVLFYNYDPSYGYELFISDGTISGTYMIKDVYAGLNSSGPANIANVNDTIALFSPGNFPITGELWRTDGTDTGTYMIKDIYPGVGVSSPGYFAKLNGKIYFSADDGTHGRELWVSDGTTSGTQLLVDIVPGSGSGNAGYFNRVGDTLFFLTSVGAYLSDGTAAGTVYLGAGGYHYTRFHDKFYSIDEGNIYETDGTPNSSSVFLTGDFGDTISRIAVFNDRMFFYNYGEPWISDGTVGGSHLLKDICPTGYSMPRCFTTFNNRVFFIANDACMSVSLFISDGTASGTYPIMPLSINQFNPLYETYELVVMDSCMYFLAKYDDIGPELWQICGTDTSAYHVNYMGINAQNQAEVNVFPNPTTHYLNIESPSEVNQVNIELYTSEGKLIQKEIRQSNKNQIDLSMLSPSIYLLKISTEDREWHYKIIKQ